MKKNKPIEVSCEYCGNKKLKKVSNIKKNPLSFCNAKCHHSYIRINNSLKTDAVKCHDCNKIFKKRIIITGTVSFCSQKCYGNNKKTGLTVNCTRCFKSKYVQKSMIKSFHSEFCSQKCKNGISTIKEKNNGYKSNYRKKALKFYKNECQNINCFLKNRDIPVDKTHLDVDHIDSNKDNNDITNLCLLCVFCHRNKTFKKSIIKLEQHEK